MKALRILLPVLVLSVLFLAPQAAFAADATFFGPIVPAECHCDGQNGQPDSAPEFGCVMAVIQNGMNFAISIGVIIFVLVASYAGFLWMFSSVNMQNREMGRTVLTNAVIGLMIALSAWLLVDFIMKAFYNETFGPWHSILGEGEHCLAVVTPPAGGAATGGTGTGGVTTGGTVEPTTCAFPQGSICFQTAGIVNQYSALSGPAKALAECIAGKVPAGRGKISSISDSAIANGTKTWAQCAAGQCQHSANSCHYGGRTCIGSSYAIDYGDGGSDSRTITTMLEAAAKQCGGTINRESNHLHVSVGGSCGCDAGL